MTYKGDRTKLLPYTNFYVEVLTQFRIKLLHVEVLTNFRIKLLHVEVLAIFPDKTSTITKLIKKRKPPKTPKDLRASRRGSLIGKKLTFELG